MSAHKHHTFILHGWSQDTSKWQPLIHRLKSQGVNPTLLHIPGLTAPLSKVWHLDDYCSWFSQRIKSHRHINVIAHSFGGRIAIRFDVKNPNLIQKLVLIDSAGIRATSIPAVIKRVSFRAVAKIGKKITRSSQARKLLYHLAGEHDYEKADQILSQTMHNIIQEDQRTDLAYVKAHTLIIWGSQDRITPLSDGRLIHKSIIGSSLQIMNDARHSPQFSHPDLVAQHIIQFLHL